MKSVLSSVMLVLDRSGHGGMQGVVSSLAEGMAAHGLTVHVVAGGTDPMPEAFSRALDAQPTLHFHSIPGAPGARGRASSTVALASTIRSINPDVLHGHGLRTSWPLAISGFRDPRRILVTCHGLPPGDLARSARLVRPTGVLVGAVGPGLERALAAQKLRTTLLQNGVSPAPAPVDKARFMASVGLDTDRPLVVYPARLSPQKDPMTLLKAIERTSACVAFVGDGPLRSDLEAAITSRGLDHRARITGWRDDARAVLGSADLLASSSTWEGQPLMILEAAAAGIPVVATRAPGVGDWLRADRDALLVDVGDAESLGSAIMTALSDPTVRSQLIRGSRTLAERHSAATMVEQHLELYETLARRR